jgi:hypothetical protein
LPVPVAAARAPQIAPQQWQGAVLPQAANLHIEVPNAGDLALHLRMQDGAASLRVEGTAAQVFAAREPELRLALSHGGVSLARFEVGAPPVVSARDLGSSTSGDSFGGGSRQQPDDSRERQEPVLPRALAPAAPARAASSRAGRVDVQA